LGGVTFVCATTLVAVSVMMSARRLSNFISLVLCTSPFQKLRRLSLSSVSDSVHRKGRQTRQIVLLSPFGTLFHGTTLAQAHVRQLCSPLARFGEPGGDR
jgi:hypothetical protein